MWSTVDQELEELSGYYSNNYSGKMLKWKRSTRLAIPSHMNVVSFALLLGFLHSYRLDLIYCFL